MGEDDRYGPLVNYAACYRTQLEENFLSSGHTIN